MILGIFHSSGIGCLDVSLLTWNLLSSETISWSIKSLRMNAEYWLVVYLPLWKIWVRQLGWFFPIWKNKKCVKLPIRICLNIPFFGLGDKPHLILILLGDISLSQFVWRLVTPCYLCFGCSHFRQTHHLKKSWRVVPNIAIIFH
jgi:hypothetical protein